VEIWKGMMPDKRWRRPDGTYPFASEIFLQAREEGRQWAFEEGRVKGFAYALFRVLDLRGVTVDEESRTRIESCRDTDVLETWVGRAAVAAKVGDLFV
jgi:hypothetical protein